jgi:hypothetical protein
MTARLAQRFHGSNHIDTNCQPRPEERAPELVEGCARLEGRPQARSRPRPSFVLREPQDGRAILRQALGSAASSG